MLQANLAPDNQTEPYTGEESESFFQEAGQVFSHAYIAALKQKGLDIVQTKSENCTITDSHNNTYLDGYTSAGIFNLGRRHPGVIAELVRASRETDQGNFVAISEEKARFAEQLCRFMPHSLDCALFTVVRGEAMDAACKLARGYTGKSRLVTVAGGAYGHTGFAMSLSGYAAKDQFGSLIPDIMEIPFADIAAARTAIDKTTAAVIIEPVQTENGCRPANQKYLQELRSICDQTGALLIFDETQTGFGRCGEKFASDVFQVLPHIMVIGEAVAAGLFPMSAIVFTRKIKSFFDQHPLIHLCTFGGHDVGCRVAGKALNVYQEQKPWKTAAHRGKQLRDALQSMQRRHAAIQKVDGIGLLQSIAFQSSLEASIFCKAARENGLILVQGEIAPETVVIRPPLTITESEVNAIIDAMEKTLQDISS